MSSNSKYEVRRSSRRLDRDDACSSCSWSSTSCPFLFEGSGELGLEDGGDGRFAAIALGVVGAVYTEDS
jgi:hypothetical protein